jgi:hypothetical protein
MIDEIVDAVTCARGNFFKNSNATDCNDLRLIGRTTAYQNLCLDCLQSITNRWVQAGAMEGPCNSIMGSM